MRTRPGVLVIVMIVDVRKIQYRIYQGKSVGE